MVKNSARSRSYTEDLAFSRRMPSHSANLAGGISSTGASLGLTALSRGGRSALPSRGDSAQGVRSRVLLASSMFCRIAVEDVLLPCPRPFGVPTLGPLPLGQSWWHTLGHSPLSDIRNCGTHHTSAGHNSSGRVRTYGSLATTAPVPVGQRALYHRVAVARAVGASARPRAGEASVHSVLLIRFPRIVGRAKILGRICLRGQIPRGTAERCRTGRAATPNCC